MRSTRLAAPASDVIVGPLTREEVALAADVGTRGVPLLALNFLGADAQAPAGMYQFALSPEDEARDVAARLLAEGHKRGVAMAPVGDWGVRVLAAFQQQFVGGGGALLAQASYDPAAHDYGADIRSAFGTNASRRGGSACSPSSLRGSGSSPGRAPTSSSCSSPGNRPACGCCAQPAAFYYAGNIGIYSTSDAYAPDAGESNQTSRA
jgi:hypothetical protein